MYLALSLLSSLVLLTVLAPPAQAAVPHIPITCGMTVRQDAVLYLTADLCCTETFAVHVERKPSEPGPVPHVLVDLRGNKLFGDGTAFGIYATGSGSSATACVADRTTFTHNTGTGFFVGGEASGTATRSTFVGNAVGASVLFPWSLSVDRSLLFRNVVGVLDSGTRVPISKSSS